MSSVHQDLRPAAARRWLAAILLFSLCINVVGVRWGLPNGEKTWAADALTPTTPMAVAKHVLGGDGFNSGWFFFKYPVGHPLLLAAVQLPYLAWLKLTHDFQSPQGSYPYGFRHPDRALLMLAMMMRGVSVLMGVGLVAMAYATTAVLFGRLAGLATAVLVAGCYPMVFYAHTPNVDVPLLFWIALAVLGALVCARERSRGAAMLAGAATAMALLTKEQSIGAVAAVPLVWALARGPLAGWKWRETMGFAVAAAVAVVAVTIVVGGVWWNPAGYVNRWRFLLGTLPAALREKYAPYQFVVQVPAGFSVAAEAEHLWKAAGIVVHALTPPVVLLCVVGAVSALRRQPRAAAVPLVAAVAYYLLSLRAAALLPVRYTMPLLYFIVILGGAGAAALLRVASRWSHFRARTAAAGVWVALLAGALLPGVEIDRLLVKDPRYEAEAWLGRHARAHGRVEIYQPLTYLPRFSAEFEVLRVPVEERTTSSFEQRQPDFVVLSSGGRSGLTGSYVRDWRPGQPVFAEVPAAKAFMTQLRSGKLGYRNVARFRTPTRWITPRINSLNPEITILTADADSEVVNR